MKTKLLAQQSRVLKRRNRAVVNHRPSRNADERQAAEFWMQFDRRRRISN